MIDVPSGAFPVLISAAVTLGTLWLNKHFHRNDQQRRENLQAPTEYLKRVQLIDEEGEAMRKEMRAQLDWKEWEIQRMRARISELEEEKVVTLETQALPHQTRRIELEKEILQLKEQVRILQGSSVKGGAA